MSNTKINKKIPVVVIIGHVDHGKSTLLDYIRKTKIVDGEAGGITQKISAYQVEYGKDKNKITFIDTPGHEAFQNMRERSIEVADIAILIVSAEDGVKEQTMQAYNTAIEKNIPVIIAINKIDKPAADIDKTKNSLLENGIYLEGMGGNITYSLISAKNGQGVDELLENIILQSEINDINYNANITATGKVLESFIDKKRGISATLIIKDGILPNSGAILAGNSLSPIRIIEDFSGKTIKSPIAGTPIMVTGFDRVPNVGSIFISNDNKKELEQIQQEELRNEKKIILDPKLYRNAKAVIPVILKSSSQLSLDAIKDKLKKYETEDIKIKIIGEGIGNINESDVLSASSDERVVIFGFEVKIENKAKEQGERFSIVPEVFDIIYKLEDRWKEIYEDRLPHTTIEKVIGKLKVLKTFGENKNRKVIGGEVIEGIIKVNALFKLLRRDFEIGTGKIANLQSMKIDVKEIQAGSQCGMEVEFKLDIVAGDIIVVSELEKVRE